MPTHEFAARFGVKGDTVRRNLCVKGHFLGLKPLKLGNGRLLWPATTPEDLAIDRKVA
ncbi:MAG: monooxygenase [Desulfobulbaceae bacterium]|nr:MAG: monooxygenase [Desulfobulbaceae bacterium]